jgi:putative membrane protein
MNGFLLRVGVNAIGLWLADHLIDGISIIGLGTFVLAGILLGAVNAVIRPLALIVTLPLTFMSLGLFVLVINAGMLALVAGLLGDFRVNDFFSAFFGALIVSLTSGLSSFFIGDRGSIEFMGIENRRDRFQ